MIEQNLSFYVSDTSGPSGHQSQSVPQPFHGECDYSSCDRDLVLAVNQHQSFADRQRACGNTVTRSEVLYAATLSKRDKALRWSGGARPDAAVLSSNRSKSPEDNKQRAGCSLCAFDESIFNFSSLG